MLTTSSHDVVWCGVCMWCGCGVAVVCVFGAYARAPLSLSVRVFQAIWQVLDRFSFHVLWRDEMIYDNQR